MEWLQRESPEQYQSLKNPPEHVTSSKRLQNANHSTGDRSPSLCGQWIKGRDDQLNINAKLTHSRDELPEENVQPRNSSRVLDRPSTSGRGDSPTSCDPDIPSKGHRKPARLLTELKVCEHVWTMSIEERKVLFRSWKESATVGLREALKGAKVDFERARVAWESARDLVWCL